jgi:hypothetical protein
VPVDDSRRDELFETFQATYGEADGRGLSQSVIEGDDEHVDDDENKPPEPDPDDDLED